MEQHVLSSGSSTCDDITITELHTTNKTFLWTLPSESVVICCED